MGFDDRDIDQPEPDMERPSPGFDLTEQQANTIARQLQEMDGVFDITRCIGGKTRGETANAYSVNFGLRLSTGHLVRGEIHTAERDDGPAVDTASNPTHERLAEVASLGGDP